ncbi:hypothetical protein ANN_18449 [Periplaneta americana]|uniref:Cytochrome P450 n=1 Tax=Periplaneta americana TaxID=6978 RepID=A0ABQ8SQ21_PERAM|nr:hypothetical protein ANN_18449 [Periplaneta americana]
MNKPIYWPSRASYAEARRARRLAPQSEGEKWHKRRKLLSNSFHSNILEDFLEPVYRESLIFADRLRMELDKPSFDIVPYAKLCALDTICDTAMGANMNAQRDSDSAYVTAIDRIKATEMKFLRRTAGYTLLDRKRNEEILEQLEVESVEEKISRYKFNWLDHERRMENSRIPTIMMQYKSRGHRRPGRPLRRLLDGAETEEEASSADLWKRTKEETSEVLCVECGIVWEGTWTLRRNEEKRIEAFEMWMWRRTVRAMREILQRRFITPWLKPDAIFYRTHYGKEQTECLKIVHSFSEKVINERKQERLRQVSGATPRSNVTEKRRRLALLDRMLEDNEDGIVLTHDDIREEVDTFIFAGHDTASTGVAWCLYVLGRHSDVQPIGAKRDEVTGEWRKLHNAELHALYSSPDIIRNIKSRRLRWAGHVARMGESRNAYRVLVGRPAGKRPLRRARRRWEDNIKMDLREVGYDGRDWINLAQDRDQ